MSREELRRVEVMGRVKAGSITLVEAAELLGLSYRHTKRVWRRYDKEGSGGLQHRSCGRESNRAKPKKLRRQVLKRVRQRYGDFGPTLASEHLREEDGLEVHPETLRRWMREDGLSSKVRKRKPYRQRRERKAHFGELVQLDGSFHCWLEERGSEGCLMHMVDDATNRAYGEFSREETIWAAVRVLRGWIRQYGVPQALYTDWKNVYVRPPNAQERISGAEPQTQFGRMCAELGIEIIAASSPQAKGRVERGHGTHQDRLVKKLRLRGTSSYAEANRYLQAHYWKQHNRRYERPPAAATNYHRQSPSVRELDRILCLKQERVVSQDWVVSYNGRWLQLQRQRRHWAPAKSRVTVCEWEDGRIQIHYRGERLSFREIASRRQQLPAVREPKVVHSQPLVPAANHPWRSSYKAPPLLPRIATVESLTATGRG